MADRDLDASTLQKAEPLRRIDRIMELVAVALFPVGLTALVLGWFGVANHGYVFLQLPYVVSGGLLGVALLVLSGLVYLASWISRTAAVQRRQNVELLGALAALQQTLAVLPKGGGNGHANGGSHRHAGGSFVATPSGSMFHRPDCAVVTDREDVHEVDPDQQGMKPCGMCDPLGSDTRAVLQDPR